MVKKFVRQFVREHGGVFRRGQVRQQRNLPAFRDTLRGSNGGGIFEPDAERKRKCGELLPVVAGIALDSSDGRERLAFGLAHVKNGARPVTKKQFLSAVPFSASFCRRRIGAKMVMPFSPLRTCRPSLSSGLGYENTKAELDEARTKRWYGQARVQQDDSFGPLPTPAELSKPVGCSAI
jgi:hypothetical protein